MSPGSMTAPQQLRLVLDLNQQALEQLLLAAAGPQPPTGLPLFSRLLRCCKVRRLHELGQLEVRRLLALAASLERVGHV